MATPCFCCTTHKDLGQGHCGNGQQAGRTKLDAALHELGMLSTVTNSRKEYLKEKGCRGVRFEEKVQAYSLSEPLPCIVQMNSNFVTDFSFSSLVTSNGASSVHVQEKFTCSSGKMRRKNRHLYRPYDFPWRPKLLKSLEKKPKVLHNLSMENDAGTSSPPVAVSVISRQDSGGNKSNPGSPVKSQKPISSSGCSIVRSRSLDDLEFSKLNLTECCSNEAGRAEIDTVSQRINNLHVS